tara:strand:+ start:533 stop:1960 length:1428 start_codon:yes stop_codon:yes gene_type:complete
MARLGQYKALGAALGGYKKSLGDVQSKEYAKEAETSKAQFNKAMYSSVGTAIANVVGIVQEKRLLEKQKDFMAREFGIGGDEFAAKVTKKGLAQNKEYFASEEQSLMDFLPEEDSVLPAPSLSEMEVLQASMDRRPPSMTQSENLRQNILPESKPQQITQSPLPGLASTNIGGIDFTNLTETQLPTSLNPLGQTQEQADSQYNRLMNVAKETEDLYYQEINKPENIDSPINKPNTDIDMISQTSSFMGDVETQDYQDLISKGIVPAQDFRESQSTIETQRVTVPTDNTTVSIEDMFIDKFKKEENTNILNASNIEENKDFTAFETEIAMSENPKYFMGDDKLSTYMDMDTKTGKDRPAEGYGVARGDKPRTRKENNQALKVHINESKKDAKRIVGNKVFSKLPEQKQEVLIELIYQMGPNRIQEFPNFLKAMVMGDFNLAANELLFTPSGEPTDWSQKGGRDRVNRIINKLRSTA